MDLEIVYQRVGKTRSGKVIPYTNNRDDIARILEFFDSVNFSMDDFFDAFAVFEYLAVRSKRRKESAAIFALYAENVFRSMTMKEVQSAKERANILTIFHIRDLGRSLVNVEFADL